ncbi:hypothetical protein JW964_17470 [candidate division KSB1 bacterium]|nr:hypothetical protein [candidate division KSB1 bacterium]
MRYFGYATLLFLLIFVDQNYSQKVIKKNKKYVVLDITQSYGLKVNDKVPVYKKVASGKIQKIGLIQIRLFQKGKCVAQILKQDPELRIEIGDFINNDEEFEFTSNNNAPSRRKVLPYLTFGTGLLASGLGYYFHDQANQSYKNYEQAKSTSEAVNYYNQTTRFDKQAKISLGVGGGLAIVGLITMFTNRSHPTSPEPEPEISMKPWSQPGQVGLTMNWNFNRPSR